jgi:hypothetical protein
VICGPPQAFYRSAACHHRNHGGAKDKLSIYTVNVNFSKIVAFKRTIRKFLNIVAVDIEGLRHPSSCLFDTLFRVSVPLKAAMDKAHN